MSTTDRDNYGTVLSYAVEEEDNELVFTDYGGFVLAVGGEKVVTDVTASTEGRWEHFCADWRSDAGGRWRIVKNGELAAGGMGLASGRTVRGQRLPRMLTNSLVSPLLLYLLGGGVMILAQEQDELGGKFSALESFRGRMTRTNFWNHTLDKIDLGTESNTSASSAGVFVAGALMRSCADIPGSVFSWGDALDGAGADLRATATPVVPCGACPPPFAPSLGSVRVRGAGVGAVAQFTCREGFMLDSATTNEEEDDDGVRSCGVLGEWDRLLPNCTCTLCGDINTAFIGANHLSYSLLAYTI